MSGKDYSMHIDWIRYLLLLIRTPLALMRALDFYGRKSLSFVPRLYCTGDSQWIGN